MNWISGQLINPPLGRPSLIKAVLCSAIMHASVISGALACWSTVVDQASFAGTRNVINVTASFVNNQTRETLQIERAEEITPLANCERVSTRPTATEMVAPRELLATKLESDRRYEQPDSDLPSEATNVDQIAARIERVNRPTEAITEPADARPEIARRVIEFAPPQTAVSVEQAPGLEEQTPPDFSGNRPPPYPREAIRRGLEGTVMLRLRITAEGQIVGVEIARSSGHTILDQSAVTAVSTWRGRPASRDGSAISTVQLLPIRFRL